MTATNNKPEVTYRQDRFEPNNFSLLSFRSPIWTYNYPIEIGPYAGSGLQIRRTTRTLSAGSSRWTNEIRSSWWSRWALRSSRSHWPCRTWRTKVSRRTTPTCESCVSRKTRRTWNYQSALKFIHHHHYHSSCNSSIDIEKFTYKKLQLTNRNGKVENNTECRP